jgi:hypothetical protein
LQNADLMAQPMFSSCRAARLFVADQTTAVIIAIRSFVERSSLWNLCNPHHLNQFHICENHKWVL